MQRFWDKNQFEIFKKVQEGWCARVWRLLQYSLVAMVGKSLVVGNDIDKLVGLRWYRALYQKGFGIYSKCAGIHWTSFMKKNDSI